MARHFCMIDTGDTHDYRWVVNIATCANMDQVIAQDLFKGKTPEEREELALRDSSDFIDRVWVWQDKPYVEYIIHVETGRIKFVSPKRQFLPDKHWVDIKEHEFKQMYGMFMNSEIMNTHQHVDLVQRKFRITNTHARPEFYDRHVRNRDIHVTKTRVSDRFTVKTSSRHCACDVDVLNVDWSTYTGALIKQSDDNCRDQLQHVL